MAGCVLMEVTRRRINHPATGIVWWELLTNLVVAKEVDVCLLMCLENGERVYH